MFNIWCDKHLSNKKFDGIDFYKAVDQTVIQIYSKNKVLIKKLGNYLK